MDSERNRPADDFDDSPEPFEGEPAPAPRPEPDDLERSIAEDTRRWEAEAQAEGEHYSDEEDSDELADEGEDVAVMTTRRRAPAGAMEDYEPTEEAQPLPPRRRGSGCADMITAIFLLLTVLVISWLILLLANPQSPLNPLPPATMPPLLVLASPEPSGTPTPSFTPEPPTATVASPTPTVTPIPTSTPTATATSTPVVGALITAGAETPTVPPESPFTPSPYPFTVKTIRYQSHDGPEGCNWLSLAGLVLGMDGQSRREGEGSLTVRVTSMDGLIDEVHYTGEPSPFPESGFEAYLGAVPREGEYTVQLIGVMGSPLSDLVTVETRGGCTENVAVVEFQQNRLY